MIDGIGLSEIHASNDWKDGLRMVQHLQPPEDFDPPLGEVETIAPGVRRIVAANPSPMTFRGTNTYLIGTRDLAVVDPGPSDERHLEAIIKACSSRQQITHIFVTHSHLDHSPLSRPLADRTGAQVLAFGGAEAGRSEIMQELALTGLVGGGEGVDIDFVPDRKVSEGEIVAGTDWAVQVMHTPGHLGNHICLALGTTCFTGDHVMGWASSLVSPPDGDLTDFMASSRKLQERTWAIFFPGHGAPVQEPNERLAWLLTHRQNRETAILNALSDGPANASDLAHRIYHDVKTSLLPAATRNVLAHLIDLTQKSRVAPAQTLHIDVPFVKL